MTANTGPGTQTTTRQLRQRPEPTDPRSRMDPSSLLSQRHSADVVNLRSPSGQWLRPDGHPPGATFWDDNNVAVEADVVPSNTTESCACLCSRVPLSPSTPSADGETKRCLDTGGVAAVWTVEMESIVALPGPLASTFPRPRLLAQLLALLAPNRRLGRASSHSTR